MTRVRALFLLLCTVVSAAVSAERWALVPLTCSTDTSFATGEGTALAEHLASFVGRSKDIELVERTQLAALASEIALGQSGLLDESKAVEAGKLAGATHLLVGSVTRTGGGTAVNLRLIDAASGVVRATATASGSRAMSCVDLAAVDLLNASGIEVRKTPSFRLRRGLGVSLLALGAGGVAAGTASHFVYVDSDKKYRTSYDLSAEDYKALRDKAQLHMNAQLAGWGVGGACLLGGIVMLMSNRSEWIFPEGEKISLIPSIGPQGVGICLAFALKGGAEHE